LPSGGVELGSLLARLEEILIRKALADCDGNQTRAARLLGLNRDQLRYRLKSYARDPS
jgi:DNA-binding protein Fis